MDGAPICLDTRDPAIALVDGGDLGEGVNLCAAAVGGAGVGPDYRIVADDSRGRMIEARQDWKVVALAHVENGYELAYIVGTDDSTVDTQGGVCLGASSEGIDGGLGVGELKSTRLAEQQVVA